MEGLRHRRGRRRDRELGSPRLQAKYIDEKGDGTATDFGPTGNEGIIGWYVPPWMAEEYPDITDWENLNKYSELFQTSESGDKGTLSTVTRDSSPTTRRSSRTSTSNYKVVFAGSETALDRGLPARPRRTRRPLGYFYEPQWFLSEVPLRPRRPARVRRRAGRRPGKVACDYPPYELNKVVSNEWAESGSPAVDLVKNFNWTNDDQNLVAKYIAEDKMDPEEAAEKWIEDNQDKVDAWLN